MAQLPRAPRPGSAYRHKIRLADGRIIASESKTGNSVCSQAVSDWKTKGMTPETARLLARCREMVVGLHAAIEQVKARQAPKRPETAEERRARLEELHTRLQHHAARAREVLSKYQGSRSSRPAAGPSKTGSEALEQARAALARHAELRNRRKASRSPSVPPATRSAIDRKIDELKLREAAEGVLPKKGAGQPHAARPRQESGPLRLDNPEHARKLGQIVDELAGSAQPRRSPGEPPIKVRTERVANPSRPADAGAKPPTGGVVDEPIHLAGDLHHIPAKRIREMLAEGSVTQVGRYVYFADVTPDGQVTVMLLAPTVKRTSIHNKYVIEERVTLGEGEDVPDDAEYDVVYVNKVTPPPDVDLDSYVERLRSAERGKLYKELYEGEGEAYRRELAASALTFGLHLLPGGAAADHIRAGEYREGALSLVGDGALLLAGPVAKLATAAKLLRAAKLARGAATAAEFGLGTYRAGQGFDALRKREYGRAAGHLGEATLRLLGVSASAIGAMRRRAAAAADEAKKAGSGAAGLRGRVDQGEPLQAQAEKEIGKLSERVQEQGELAEATTGSGTAGLRHRVDQGEPLRAQAEKEIRKLGKRTEKRGEAAKVTAGGKEETPLPKSKSKSPPRAHGGDSPTPPVSDDVSHLATLEPRTKDLKRGGGSSDLGDKLINGKKGDWADQSQPGGLYEGLVPHHVIPEGLRNHRVIKAIGYKMQSVFNGIILPKDYHPSNHVSFTAAVRAALNAIKLPEQATRAERLAAAREVEKLVIACKRLLDNRTPLNQDELRLILKRDVTREDLTEYWIGQLKALGINFN